MRQSFILITLKTPPAKKSIDVTPSLVPGPLGLFVALIWQFLIIFLQDFCLAHLFTDIKFEGGILGLAYVGSPRRNSVGGICTPEYFKNGYTLYLNSGLSSSRNHYGQRLVCSFEFSFLTSRFDSFCSNFFFCLNGILDISK